MAETKEKKRIDRQAGLEPKRERGFVITPGLDGKPTRSTGPQTRKPK